MGRVSPGLSAARDLSPYCRLRLHFQLLTVWSRLAGIASCLAVDENGRTAAVEPRGLAPKHPEFQLVGKRVDFQINMDLAVSRKARPAHQQYCLYVVWTYVLFFQPG